MNRKKKGIAFAAACILLALAVRPGPAYGAAGIETERTDCAVIFDLNVEYRPEGESQDAPLLSGDKSVAVNGSRYAELQDHPVEIDLYRVASVDAGGRYTALDGYSSLQKDLSSVNAATAAQQWEEMAKAAQEIALSGTEAAAVSGFEFRAGAEEAARTVSGLKTGLYLVAAKEAVTDEYIYPFLPCLVALPGNDYTPGGDSDEWLYTVHVGLKPGQENRYGDLEIIKTLNSYNATLGGASFVFQVEAEKDGVVYSDVVSMAFDRPGTKSVKITGKIPAGAQVTVTEVYSGTGYQAVSGLTQTAAIAADRSAAVSFVNEYGGGLNGGSSVVNHFYQKDTGESRETDSGSGGVWDWRQMIDSTEEAGGQ